MKNIYLFLIFIIICANTSAQTVFSDDFESYAVGSYVGTQSTYWTTWSGATGGAEDAMVSDTYASSGSNSIAFSSTGAQGGPQDVVLDFGQLYNDGIFTLESDFYIMSGKNAYFNIQGSQAIGSIWALNINMDNGQVIIDDGAQQASGAYTNQTWFSLKIEANLTLGVWKAFIDNNLIGTWNNAVNTVASIDLYPIQNSDFYVDDISFGHQPYTMPNLNAMVAGLNMGGTIAGQTVTPTITIVNAGQSAITDASVTLEYNGSTTPQTISGVNIASTASYDIVLPSLNLTAGSSNVVAYITSINGGNDDESSDDTLTQNINPTVPAPGKMVISEEATGTWCQWCPRGAVYMDLFEAAYSGFWVGVAVHNGDPMTDATYDAGFGTLIGGYPSATVDRGADVDPSQMTTEFLSRLQTVPVAVIQNGATWDPATRQLDVSLTSTFNSAANNNYKIACVITEDNVTGTTSGYNQSNAYAGGGNGVMGGFENLPSSVPAAQMVYNHVARSISPSFIGDPNSFPASVNNGDVHTSNFSYTLPAEWDENEIHIVGLLIDPQGRVDNASKSTIPQAVSNGWVDGGGTTGINTILNQIDETVQLYPNPAKENVTIQFNLKEQSNISAKLTDLSGKQIAFIQFEKQTGIYKSTLPVDNLNAGIYYFEFIINNEVKVIKFIKE